MSHAETISAQRRPRAGSKGEARRESIMDAAEEIFSDKGYYGSSMRDISQRSGAALGLITHYFAAKDALFRDVIDRKRGMLLDVVSQSIDAAMADPAASTASIIRAFVEPFLAVSTDEASPLRNYVRLTSHVMSTYRDPELIEPLQRLRPVSDIFSNALARHLGIEADDNFLAAIYIIESAMIFMTQDSGFLRDLTDGRLSKIDLDRFVDRAACFFTGGVAALVRTR